MYKLALGFLTGFIAGVAVVLYAAPNKVQKQIKNAVEDQVDNVERLVKKVVNA